LATLIVAKQQNKSSIASAELLEDSSSAYHNDFSSSGATLDCRATPGVTTRADIRKGATEGKPLVVPTSLSSILPDSLPVSEQNSSPSPSGQCGVWAVLSECESGKHHFAKRIVCGKEWCPECGHEDSAAHKRRQSRLIKKMQQISSLAYYVIEFPDKYRHIGRHAIDGDPDEVKGWCYSKADLRDTANTIINVMAGKRMGKEGRVGGFYARGLLRWHYFGDKVEGKWNPHANVLVEGGYIEPEKLQEIKTALRDALNCPDLIVHYSYAETPGQIMHKLKYVTRATFLNYDWNPYMAEELYNFRNQRWWGIWKDEPAWVLCKAEAEGADISGLERLPFLRQ
jgi:hypothetical protein